MVEEVWLLMKIKPITGIKRFFFDIYLILSIFFRYTGFLLKRKISFKQYILFFKRMILLQIRFRYNKVIRIGNVYKLHLYLPAFPSVAFFHALKRFLMLKGEPSPVSVLLSVTKACTYNCPHCYQKMDTGSELSDDRLNEVAKEMQSLGISFFNIEGGEPLLKFDKLLKLVRSLDERAEVWVNTNGFGLTEEKAKKMKEVGVFGVMISVHHWDRIKFDKFVGKDGAFDDAISALEVFREAGIATAINCCPTKETIEEGGIEKIMKLAKDHGCSYVQLIHGKPAGGWLGRKDPLKDEIIREMARSHTLFNKHFKFRNYPAMSSQVFESLKGNFGCTAGGIERFYLNHHGEVQPCEFTNVSFGNVQDEDFFVIYKRMKSYFKKPGANWLCCTEAERIEKAIRAQEEKKIPLPKEKTISIVKDWDLGEETPLYKKMGLYGKE
jgi:MoaA/NifB/PqqE/SkfB family radical SAM enzyme